MLNIVVFSGGTGSVALQTGISEVYGLNNLNLDIIVNAYDNGKSTGVCRRVFNNKILGPSDVRKNQLLQFSLRYREEMKDKSSRHYRLYELFEIRPSAPGPLEYYTQAKEMMKAYDDIFDEKTKKYLYQLLDYFFYEQEDRTIMRKTVFGESFEDFSLSNIFYASSAAMNGYSLEAAADDMAKLLDIPCNVHLISDISLILQAETESGHIIEDEGEIVEWDNAGDKIVRAILLNDGKEYIPNINEESTAPLHSVETLVKNADIIIFSSGTQWASLIPTYMHNGFKELISSAKAKKYLIMNNIEDHDALGVSAGDFCEILSNYLNMDEITVVLNECAVPTMRKVPEKYHAISGKLSELDSKKHTPKKLITCIMVDYYGKALSCKNIFWDLDETLWYERGNEKEKVIGRENLALFEGIIISGNSINHMKRVFENNAPEGKYVEIFADYGNSYLTTKKLDMVSYFTEEFDLPENLAEEINKIDGLEGKAKLRGKTVITVKPLENRTHWIAVIKEYLKNYGMEFSVAAAGKTSVDIRRVNYTKAVVLSRILEQKEIALEDVLFVGNELIEGSEVEIAKLGVETLQVNDVYECNMFLRTLKEQK